MLRIGKSSKSQDFPNLVIIFGSSCQNSCLITQRFSKSCDHLRIILPEFLLDYSEVSEHQRSIYNLLLRNGLLDFCDFRKGSVMFFFHLLFSKSCDHLRIILPEFLLDYSEVSDHQRSIYNLLLRNGLLDFCDFRKGSVMFFFHLLFSKSCDHLRIILPEFLLDYSEVSEHQRSIYNLLLRNGLLDFCDFRKGSVMFFFHLLFSKSCDHLRIILPEFLLDYSEVSEHQRSIYNLLLRNGLLDFCDFRKGSVMFFFHLLFSKSCDHLRIILPEFLLDYSEVSDHQRSIYNLLLRNVLLDFCDFRKGSVMFFFHLLFSKSCDHLRIILPEFLLDYSEVSEHQRSIYNLLLRNGLLDFCDFRKGSVMFFFHLL
ncbi:hypothetical protein DMENIID0001_001900 [Sergentomyia squamirostris]